MKSTVNCTELSFSCEKLLKIFSAHSVEPSVLHQIHYDVHMSLLLSLLLLPQKKIRSHNLKNSSFSLFIFHSVYKDPVKFNLLKGISLLKVHLYNGCEVRLPGP